MLALQGPASGQASAEAGFLPSQGPAALPGGRAPALGAVPMLGAAAADEDSMVRVDNIEGQLRASSVRRLAELVEKHPEESLSIVRAWMLQEPRA